MDDTREAAVVVLLRRREPAPEVYLVRRDPGLAFLGGFHALPGGTLHQADEAVTVEAAPLAAKFCSAAVRELFEETGVLLARGAERLSADERNAMRKELIADASLWPRLLAAHALRLDGAGLMPMGAWLTPPYSPLRFFAHYLGAWLPDGQTASVWPGELTEGLWVGAAEALARHNHGELFITYPVLETLRVLAAAPQVEVAARTLAARGDEPFRFAGGEMLAGVHVVPLRTNTLPPATHTNCYVLGGRDLVVVDPGSPFDDEQERLVRYLHHLGEQGGVLREVWLTHHHPDHVGAVDHLRRELKVKVAAHRHTADHLGGEFPVEHLIDDHDTLRLDTGHGVAEWSALYTPGHANGHLCFYERQRGTLLSGDNVVGLGTVVVASPDGNMVDYMASLRRLLSLKLGFLFPGHGPPVATAGAKIQEYIEHRTMRETRILAVVSTPLTPAEIVPRVYTDVAPAVYGLAEMNVRAHLEKLVVEGRVREAGGSFVRAS